MGLTVQTALRVQVPKLLPPSCLWEAAKMEAQVGGLFVCPTEAATSAQPAVFSKATSD